VRPTGDPARFKTVDGLRGIAALAVVCYHLNGAILETYGKWLPGPAAWLLSHGYLGVDIFFVISGFVIAYSVRNAERSLGFLGRFAVRRSIRLDPPYWAAILVEIAVLWAGLRWGLAEAPLPSVRQFLSHFLYLQNILGYGDIINIFWTLCFEIQFYLGLVLLLLVHRRIELHFGARSARLLGGLVLAGLFLYSLAVRFEVFGLSIHPSVALPPSGVDYEALVSAFEEDLIVRALDSTGWNKNRAAQLLNLKRTTLVEKIRSKGIAAPEERSS